MPQISTINNMILSFKIETS